MASFLLSIPAFLCTFAAVIRLETQRRITIHTILPQADFLMGCTAQQVVEQLM